MTSPALRVKVWLVSSTSVTVAVPLMDVVPSSVTAELLLQPLVLMTGASLVPLMVMVSVPVAVSPSLPV